MKDWWSLFFISGHYHLVQYSDGTTERLLLEDADIEWIFNGRENFGKEFIGKRVRIYDPRNKFWYEGTVKSFHEQFGMHLIHFDSGHEEVFYLHRQKIEWVKGMLGEEMVGKRIILYKPQHMIWYEGFIRQFDSMFSKHWVQLDNGQVELLQLELEKFVCVEEEEVSGEHRIGDRFNLRVEDGWKVGHLRSFNRLLCTHLVEYIDRELQVLQLDKEKVEWVKTKHFYKEEVLGKRIRVSRSQGLEVFEGRIDSYDSLLSKHWIHSDDGRVRVLELDNEVIECLSPPNVHGEIIVGKKIMLHFHHDKIWFDATVESFDSLSGIHSIRFDDDGGKAHLLLQNEEYVMGKNGEMLVGKKISILSTGQEWDVISFDNPSGMHTIRFSDGTPFNVNLDLKPHEWTIVKKLYGGEVIDKRLRIYQPHAYRWYGGVVKRFDSNLKKHLVRYEDGRELMLQLEKEKIKWLPEEKLHESEVLGKKFSFFCHRRKGWIDGCVESIDHVSKKLRVLYDNGERGTLGKEDIVLVSEKDLYAEEVIGKRARIYSPHLKVWQDGCVLSFDSVHWKHSVQYDDGEIKTLNLEKSKIEWLKEELRVYPTLGQSAAMPRELAH